MITIQQVLEHAINQQVTDIHISANAPVLFRIGGKLTPICKESLSASQSRELSLQLLNDRQKEQLGRALDYDFMLAMDHNRYRINIGHFNGSIGATIRILPSEPKTIDQLELPETVRELAQRKKGLVLITGSTSQGKTTTLTSMIDHINTHFPKHIITIEDPIEYLHANKKGLVRQRQILKDTKDFSSGLRAALRQDPDIIAIGEMRDYETIKIALTAAETGVLVLSTLHVISIDKILERLFSYGQGGDENQLRYLLAESLQGIIHQELVPTVDGSRHAACEILVVTNAARNIIRRRGGFFLRNIIETGRKHGMLTMADSIGQLQDRGIISEAIATSVLANYK
ncbi:MAG: PilT/PilU family type 4a pilus ATPase [Planctomycetes bacterium]|nr:PilT/PilU family type 4a pilus ATPase [Planctomycetota bacterium]